MLLVGRVFGCSFVGFVFVAFVGVVGVSEEEPCEHEESDGVEGGVNNPVLKLFLDSKKFGIKTPYHLLNTRTMDDYLHLTTQFLNCFQ